MPLGAQCTRPTLMKAKQRHISLLAAVMVLLSSQLLGSLSSAYPTSSQFVIPFVTTETAQIEQNQKVENEHQVGSQRWLFAEISEEETEERQKHLKTSANHTLSRVFYRFFFNEILCSSSKEIRAFNLQNLNTAVPCYLFCEVFRL